MLSIAKLLFPLLIAATVGVAQGHAFDNAIGLPECARQCVDSAEDRGLCPPGDSACSCTNNTYEQDITNCILASCSFPESLISKNISSTNCGAPIRNRSVVYTTTTYILTAISLVFVATRFIYKLWVAHLPIGMDDYFILVTMIASIPNIALNLDDVGGNAIGQDIWTQSPKAITEYYLGFFIISALYFFQTATIKLSIIAFYMRIFPAREVQRMLWATFVVTAMWSVAFLLWTIFQCQPVNFYWKEWEQIHKGHCSDPNALTWSHAAIGIVIDIWMLAIPLWQIRSLQLHWKKKVGVAVMFCVGTFVTIVSIIRLQSLVSFHTTANFTWDSFDISIWSMVEISVGIICACLPAIRMLLVGIFPALLGSKKRSTGGGQYYQYGSKSGGGVSRNHTAQVFTTQRPDDSEEELTTPGIVFQKSYTVQYSDGGDETGLVPVPLNDLDEEGKKK